MSAHPSSDNCMVSGGSSRLAELSVVIVSYNTRELTLAAIKTLLENAGDVDMQVIVWDNASQDGSAQAISKTFPDVNLVAHNENIGFARANNAAIELVESDWVLLLNPDTETHPGAIERLLNFAKDHPQAGIVGGRTVFRDGSLNPSSCWAKMSKWSLFCQAFGLTALFPKSRLFDPESIGNWARDTVRKVDIVVGCFFLLRRDLWTKLGGFDRKYFMYGEETDLCLRAQRLGYQPMITPDAQIMHVVGASENAQHEKIIRLMRAKATLIKDHWGPISRVFGSTLLWFWIANRRVASIVSSVVSSDCEPSEKWKKVWDARAEWLRGYD